jgi:Domain of unknown function (DUF1995)
MISFGTSSSKKSFPKDVKEAVTRCRASVQEALGKRISRMDIEFPVGANFGVEKGEKKQSQKKSSAGVAALPTKDLLDTSDRELARIFVEMFQVRSVKISTLCYCPFANSWRKIKRSLNPSLPQPLGGDAISVVFTDGLLADKAKTAWKDDSSSACRILALGRRKSSQSTKKKPKGFAAKMAAEVDEEEGGPFALPDKTELAIFVSPGPKELLAVEQICSEVGMGTLVILLNARLASISNFGSDTAKSLFLQEFEPVFSLCAAPQEEAPNCLLHRSYPNNWMMARKPKVGQPKLVMEQDNRPTADNCKQAYDSIEIGELEQGVENVLENVAGWFN